VYGYALRNGNTQNCPECSKRRKDEAHNRVCASAFHRNTTRKERGVEPRT
jgi:hypothetical protein